MFRLRCVSGTVRLRQVRVVSRRRHIAAQTLQIDKTLSHGEFIHTRRGIDTHKHIQRPLRLFNPQLSFFSFFFLLQCVPDHVLAFWSAHVICAYLCKRRRERESVREVKDHKIRLEPDGLVFWGGGDGE